MSVLINGMKMPTDCWDCPAHNDELGYCQVTDETLQFKKGILPNCPIVEPKRGEWVEDKYTRKCSVCGSTYWRRGGDEWNYCPNCGSKNGGEG